MMMACLWYSLMFLDDGLWFMGLLIFLLAWIIFVPVAVTSRLEKIIQLLKEKNK